MTRLRNIVAAVVGVLVLCLAAFIALAWRPAIAPVAPPSRGSFPAAQVARGKVLAGAGYCAVCHTRGGGAVFAGGYGVQTPFGTIYSTNITPDPDTGIGRWSEQAFARAMHEGVARDGSHLFPAFPYDHFTKISDADVQALYAYLMAQQPVRAAARGNTIPFPLNIRLLQEGWKLLFFRSGRYQPDPSQSAQWNRGAYLAQGLSHCGACHTPLNFLGAEKDQKRFGGTSIVGWIAPALTDANPSPVPWSQQELFRYLRSGVAPLHGVSAGPMGPVIHTGLSAVPDADINALAVYFADVDHAAARGNGGDAVARALAVSARGSGQSHDPDARLYAGACLGCHYNAPPAPLAARPELALTSALRLPEPDDLIHVMLHGIGLHEGGPGLTMPSYGSGLSDHDIARIAAYLRGSRTQLPAWHDLQKKVAEIRQQPASQ